MKLVGTIGRKVCHYDPDLIDEIDRAIHDGVIQGLFVRKSVNMPDDSVAWLGQFMGLKRLGIFDFPSSISLSGLNLLPNLEELLIDGKSPIVDFAWFKALKSIQMDWHPGVFKNEQLSKLEDLSLWHYSPNNLNDLKCFSHLKKLKLVQSKIESLEGLHGFINLEHLEFHYMSKLKDISGLNLKSLKYLSLENCKKIADYSPIANCGNLEIVRIHESSAINSLAFITKLNSLKSFRFIGTDVVNGDLSPLLNIDDVYFTQKRHFSHKLCDFPKLGP